MKAIVRAVLLCGIGFAMAMNIAMANDLNQAGNSGSTVSYNGLSLAPSTFKITEGHYSYAMRGQTGDGAARGIGVFEGVLSERDEADFQELTRTVCSIDAGALKAPRSDLYLAAILSCPEGRKFDSMFSLIGLGEPGERINRVMSALLSSFSSHGEAVAKLDVSATVEPHGSRLLVTLRFSNGGRQDVAFISPAMWEGTSNPIAGKSYADVVGAKGRNADEQFFMRFGGEMLVDRASFADEALHIPAGQSKEVRFLVYPDRRFVKGRYAINGGAFIGKVLKPEALAGSVDFTFREVDVTFAENFPSAVSDLNDFEGHRRKQLFGRTHAVGDLVEEAGYYRAYGDGGARDDFPELLRKGASFPERTIEHQEQGTRKGIGPATIWRWEAYPDAKMTAVTGERCPRAGYWIPEMPGGLTASGQQVFKLAADKRRVRADEVMPRLGLGKDSALRWTWLGDIGET